MLLIINITKERKKALLTVSPSIKDWVNRAIQNAADKILNENLFITDEELEEYHNRLILNGENVKKKRHKCTQATKDKISRVLKEKYKGQHFTMFEETKKKIGDIHRGKIVSQATRDKVSKANKGKKRTEEQRKRISLAKTGQKYKKRVQK